MSKVTDYIKETRAEFTHVNWPTRTQAVLISSAFSTTYSLSALRRFYKDKLTF